MSAGLQSETAHGGENAKTEYEPASARIMLASDLHYLSPALTDHGPFFEQVIASSDGKVMEYSDELADAFLETVLRERPDALVLSGDLTCNGALQSHTDLAKKLQKLADNGIQALVIPGNHDLENGSAVRYAGDGCEFVESVTAEQFARIYGAFGYEGALSRDSASLSYVWALSRGVRLLFVDVNGVERQCCLPEETAAWVKQQLEQAQRAGAHVIAFSHQNLLAHSIFISGYVIDGSEELLPLYEDYGVLANFSGHLHIQHIARSDGGLYEAATSALAITPNQYAWLRLKGDTLRYETVPTDVASWAAEKGLGEPNLLNFSAYAREFFHKTGYEQAMDELGGSADAHAMAEYFAQVNGAYFTGRLDALAMQPELQRRWTEYGGFLSAYVANVVEQKAVDMNTLTIYP